MITHVPSRINGSATRVAPVRAVEEREPDAPCGARNARHSVDNARRDARDIRRDTTARAVDARETGGGTLDASRGTAGGRLDAPRDTEGGTLDSSLGTHSPIPDAEGDERGAPCVKPSFVLASLLDDVARHEELDLDTLRYHVRQSDETAADGYWHASINEARSFLEALLVGMLGQICAVPGESHANSSRNGTPFRCYRRRLVEAGFLDADENDLLQYVYSIASAKGSHHGVTDEAWTRLARRMVWIAAQYLLTRYEVWKSGGTSERRWGTLDRAHRLSRAFIARWFARWRECAPGSGRARR